MPSSAAVPRHTTTTTPPAPDQVRSTAVTVDGSTGVVGDAGVVDGVSDGERVGAVSGGPVPRGTDVDGLRVGGSSEVTPSPAREITAHTSVEHTTTTPTQMAV